MTKTLEEALRSSGLDDDSIRLIIKRKSLAKFIAHIAVLASLQMKQGISHVGYHGKIDIVRLPQIAEKVKRRDGRITEAAIAREFDIGETAFNNVLRRYPEIRKLFEVIRLGAVHING